MTKVSASLGLRRLTVFQERVSQKLVLCTGLFLFVRLVPTLDALAEGVRLIIFHFY